METSPCRCSPHISIIWIKISVLGTNILNKVCIHNNFFNFSSYMVFVYLWMNGCENRGLVQFQCCLIYGLYLCPFWTSNMASYVLQVIAECDISCYPSLINNIWCIFFQCVLVQSCYFMFQTNFSISHQNILRIVCS